MKISWPILIFCALVGASIFLGYYFQFIDCIEGGCSRIDLPYNTPDHFIYKSAIDDMADLPWWVPLFQNYGISFLYHYILIPIFSIFFGSENINPTTFIFNCGLYFCILATFARISKKINISGYWIFLLAVYPPFTLFSALVNKDMLLTYLVLLSCVALIDKRWIFACILIFFLTLVRVQYAILLPLAIFMLGGQFRYRFFLCYVGTSLLAAGIVRFSDIFILRDAAGGLSDLVYNLNKSYLIGSLLLNPARLLQYFLSFTISWKEAFVDNQFTLMRIIEGITFFWFLLISPYLWRFFWRHRNQKISYEAKVVKVISISFILILLLTSITEQRYLMSIYPVILLAAGFSCRHQGIVTKRLRGAARVNMASSSTANDQLK